MKKLVSIILLMSIVFTTAYADYDYKMTQLAEGGPHLDIYNVSDNCVRYNLVGPVWQTHSGSIFGSYIMTFDGESWTKSTFGDDYYGKVEYRNIPDSTNCIRITYPQKGMFPFKKCSLVDSEDNVLGPEETYDDMELCQGAIIVCKDDKYGVINFDGEIIKPLETEFFELCDDGKNVRNLNPYFDEDGIAITKRVVDGEEKRGAVNARLEVIVDFEYDYLYKEGSYVLVPDQESNLRALVDNTGKFFTPFRYSNIDYEKGKFNVTYKSSDGTINRGVLKEDGTEYVNLENCSYDLINDENLILKNKKGQVLTNLKGTALSSYYKTIKHLSNTFFLVENNNGCYGVIDNTGREIVPTEYKVINNDLKANSNFFVCYKEGIQKYDIYNADGKMMFSYSGVIDSDNYLSFDKSFKFFLGENSDGAYEFLNTNGEIVASYKCDYIDGSFYKRGDGTRMVFVKKDDGDLLLDENLNEIDLNTDENVYYEWHYAVSHNENLFVNRLFDKCALIDKETMQYIIPYSAGLSLYLCQSANEEYCKAESGRCCVYDSGTNKKYIFDDTYAVVAEFPGDIGVTEYFDDGFYLAYPDKIYDFTGRLAWETNAETSEFTEYVGQIHKINDGMYVGVIDRKNLVVLNSTTINLAYNTDIRTFINGVEIPCYAVDGYPCVFAEDLVGYLFDVAWSGDGKSLVLTRNPEYVEINPVEVPEKGEHNTIFADIYANDVNVTVNGNAVKSYNADGKLLIRAKDLENSGVAVTYENKKTIFDVLKETIEVYVNDEKVAFDQQPILKNSRTLVPVRAIFEALGATVEWNDITYSVYVK